MHPRNYPSVAFGEFSDSSHQVLKDLPVKSSRVLKLDLCEQQKTAYALLANKFSASTDTCVKIDALTQLRYSCKHNASRMPLTESPRGQKIVNWLAIG